METRADSSPAEEIVAPHMMDGRRLRSSWTHPRLWHKAWLESRGRFLMGAAALSLYDVNFVQGARHNFPPPIDPAMPYSKFVWHGIYNGVDVPIFVLVALILGLGGVQRERASGTAAFTLSLPVSRAALVTVRALVAVLEVVALSLLPVLVIPWLSPHYTQQSYPVMQALQFALIFSAVGVTLIAMGVLWSSVLTGEHTALIACLITAVVYGAAVSGPVLRKAPSINVLNVLNGSGPPYLDPTTAFLVAVPWRMLFVLVIAAAGVISAAAYVTHRQDFS